MRAPTSLVAVAALALAAPAPAGPLTPPSGPITPTHKTLTQVEPRTPVGEATTPGTPDALFVLDRAGSYYLTSNILVPQGKNGIDVTAPNVTLDLAGFVIEGAPGSLDGVFVRTGASNVTIRNGAIRALGGDGVDSVLHFYTVGMTVEDLRVSACGGSGIATTALAMVRRCHVQENALSGVLARTDTRVTECVATNNAGHGFDLDSLSTLTECTAYINSLWGARGVDGVRVERCHLSANGLSPAGGGISVAGRSTVRDNTVVGHPGRPAILAVGAQNTIEANVITDAGTGVSVGGVANLIVRNSLKACGTAMTVPNGNVHGPLVVIVGGGDLGSIPGSMHPAANIIQ